MEGLQDTYEHSYYAENRVLSSLSVYNVGRQRCSPAYQWGPGIRDHYLLHHVLRGKGYFELGGRAYHLKAGDTFLIYPNMEACYRADEEDPWEYTWVGFSGNDAFSLLNHTDFSVESPVLEQASISEEIEEKIMEVYELKGSTFYDAVSMTGALYAMIAMLMEKSTGNGEQTNRQASYVERAVQYITEHYSYPITVGDVADYTGICRSHLYRLFQKYQGTSPKDYLTEYRIHQAGRLLKETDLPIASIAYSVGFEDNFYFSKSFKQWMGKTPSAYRNETQKDAAKAKEV